IGDRSQPVTYRVTTGRRGDTGCDAEHCDTSGWSQTGACSGQEDRWCLGARWIRVTEWIRRGVAVAVGHGGIEYRVVAGERSCGGVVRAYAHADEATGEVLAFRLVAQRQRVAARGEWL